MKFQKFSKNKLIIGGVMIALVAVVSSIILLGGSGPDEYVTDTVKRGFIQQTVEVTGSLESVDDVDLSFNTSGNLDTVYVRVGDIVEKGDLLAELEAEDLKADVRRAEQSYNLAAANLNLEIQGASDESIAVRNASVNISSAALTSAQAELNKVVLATAASLQKAQDDYENTVAQNELSAVEVNEDYVGAMKSAMIGVRYGLSEADKVLGVENTIVNDSFESILSHQNTHFLNDAKRAFEDTQKSRDAAEGIVFALNDESTDEELNTSGVLLQHALDDVQMTLLYTRQALDATTLETADFSLTDLATLKSTIDSARDAVQLDEQNFYSQKQIFLASVQTMNTNLDNVANALNIAQIDAQTAVTSAEATVAMRQADLASAQASLAEFTAIPRDVDLAGLQASVASSLADLDAAKARLAKAQIYSPIEGQVTDVALEIGEQVSAAMPFVTVQSSGDLFEVTLDVPEADIIKVSIGDEARIEFDAYGDDISVAGEVVKISPAQKDVEGVVYYEVTVMLDDVSDELSLKPGMSTGVIIITDEKNGALYVSQRSVLENDNGEKYVRIPSGSKYKEIIVETGLRADGGIIEIKSGVEEGETIIITIK